MNIAIDYDGTYTEDHALWDSFIELCQQRGHTVKCVTMRYPEESIDMPIGVQIIYTSRKPKFEFAPDSIWIDDQPRFLFQGG